MSEWVAVWNFGLFDMFNIMTNNYSIKLTSLKQIPILIYVCII
jgi:hypothetical protein